MSKFDKMSAKQRREYLAELESSLLKKYNFSNYVDLLIHLQSKGHELSKDEERRVKEELKQRSKEQEQLAKRELDTRARANEIASIRADLDTHTPAPTIYLRVPSTEDVPAHHQIAQAQSLAKQLELVEAERKFKEHERLRQQRQAHAAEKRAQGKTEVQHGCIVTVRNLEDGEELLFYLCPLGQRNMITGRELAGISHADLEAISADAPLARELHGRFVGDEISIHVSGAELHYLILSVQPYIYAPQLHEGNTTRIQAHEHDVYSGRGKPEQGESQALDGSRYIGFMAPDGNQWGSFPLYDDMGDESNAEGCDYDERFDVDVSDKYED